MLLPPDFQFSQACLQDFVDCPRRFLLRYVLNVVWPAVEMEPIEEQERRMELGRSFHRLVQQHLVGIPEERLVQIASRDPDLEQWWRNYRVYQPVPALLAAQDGISLYPEVTLAATVARYRLVAKYDLVAVYLDSVRAQQWITIFDWKTSGKRTSSSRLKSRLQTRVYRYLLVRAGEYLVLPKKSVDIEASSTENKKSVYLPEQVEMIYWFAGHPESPERLPYNIKQYEEDTEYLTGLIERIQHWEVEAFVMTEDEAMCKYCPYRSYCDRGVEAGILDTSEDAFEVEDLSLPDFDFEQIAEIAF
ncbi:MAG: PD-(D/E)XK nuclease family protein [Anaerolineae bacterium]|nr:PD-(D/E)XK nuclease family protein [Anaerolineae bacterium]